MLIKNYDTFRIDSLLERVDYEWDLEIKSVFKKGFSGLKKTKRE